jgi:acyl-CoA thioester hydrolase
MFIDGTKLQKINKKLHMKSNEIQIKIRYGETDKMGVVHHGNYALYLEIGRINWLKDLGISYKEMEDNGIGLPVVYLQMNFKKSVFFDDEITVKTTLKKRPTATVEFDYEIVNTSGETILLANTVLAFIDFNTRRPVRPPKYFLDALD